MFLVSSYGCLCPIYWSHVLTGEWRCSWCSADRWCSNYIWVINNLIDNQSAPYIRDLTVSLWRFSCHIFKFTGYWYFKGQHWVQCYLIISYIMMYMGDCFKLLILTLIYWYFFLHQFISDFGVALIWYTGTWKCLPSVLGHNEFVHWINIKM